MCEAPANKRCRFCKWFYSSEITPFEGECRKTAPPFTIMAPSDWCGEFELCPENDMTNSTTE